ncbi:LpqB family beta-propeller domain-containing protein [Streptomyces sp. NPDC087859]|uniref:LpqB family beta-propeller domain-containing protein n=1 Tax=Streptomyces sp. NPDC087859 TaxID=3365812 RepID=UPI00382022FD
MGADRVGGGRRGPVRTVVSVACGAVLLAGCASMPDSGDLRGVESTPRQDPQVRVYAQPPRENAEAPEIVDGFLEALTSDDSDFETARKYLTANVARTWKPEASLTVLADGPDSSEKLSSGGKDSSDAVFSLTGEKVATVDGQQVYSPAGGQYDKTLHLVREKKSKQWRIDSPPGVVMGKSDFLRNYTSVNRYYFASNSSTESDGQPVAVADPVYVRKKVDPMTQTVSLLLAGPSRWLNPVVRSSFPTGTALKKDVTQLTPDDQNRLTVPLNAKADRVGSKKCQEMAAQLLFTLRDLTPTGVSSVELQRSDGTQLCGPLDESDVETAVVHEVAKDGYQYFIDSKHRLVRLASASTNPESFAAVPGALGEGEKELRSAAVSRDELKAAGVSLDGSDLYVGSLVSGASLGEPVLHSDGKTQNDRLTTPSWDGEGDLWVADRDPDHPRLLLLKNGAGEPIEVDTTGLDGRIDAVRMAADGVRIALIVEKGSKKSLYVGRIERGDKASGQKPIAVVEPRSVAPQLVEVTAMSWAGDSRLVVVGREDGGVQQMAYVQVDGSTPVGSAPAALTGVKVLASSEDEQLPLMAYSEEDGIVRLLSGAKWQQVVKDGTAPVYPG